MGQGQRTVGQGQLEGHDIGRLAHENLKLHFLLIYNADMQSSMLLAIYANVDKHFPGGHALHFSIH